MHNLDQSSNKTNTFPLSYHTSYWENTGVHHLRAWRTWTRRILSVRCLLSARLCQFIYVTSFRLKKIQDKKRIARAKAELEKAKRKAEGLLEDDEAANILDDERDEDVLF